ncbi:DUF4190 domain-containing protein [Georgenia sp. SYP-B2076]|uniref:DUF4190 domain-containing protein n=1 Tax=Georgenia sp. SYP-B2076 TaxID=2495881 RepID=UPI000F8E88EC|nr:DUF4190 domain-containing protein [Georgenia sp. SYP-B2076]
MSSAPPPDRPHEPPADGGPHDARPASGGYDPGSEPQHGGPGYDPRGPLGQQGAGDEGPYAPQGQSGPPRYGEGSPGQPDPYGQGAYGQPHQYGQGQYGQPAQYGQPGVTYAGGPYGVGPHGGPRNGLGVAALVVGIASVLVAWVPFVGLLGLLGGIVAIILGAVALGRVRRREATNRSQSIAGIVLGALAVLLGIGSAIFGSYLISQVAPEVFGPDFQRCVETYGNNPQALQECLQRAGY